MAGPELLVLAILGGMEQEAASERPPVRLPTFDHIAVRLLLGAVAAAVAVAAVVFAWRGFTWLMALSSGAGVGLLVFLTGRAVRVLRFAYLRPPFERED